MLNIQKLLVFLHLIIIVTFTHISKTYGLTLRMIPIHSPHLQIVRKETIIHERLQLLSNISMSRVHNHRILSPNGIKAQIIPAKGNYFVTKLTFGEGRGAYSPYVALDTGSDITWVQCKGCDPCFELNGQNFDYKNSRSFRRVQLNDELCSPPFINYKGTCGLSLKYGFSSPQSSVTGFCGRENFYFKNSRTNNMDVYPGLLFLCGIVNENIKFGLSTGPRNIIAGVLGLNAKPKSFLTQLEAQTHGKLFYCLPSFSLSTPPQSTIYLGDDAQISGYATGEVQTISMYGGGKYHLYLSGISVDGNRLQIDPSIFELDEEYYTKGFFIDSGSPFSALPRSVYNPLKNALVQSFRDTHGLNPIPNGQIMDLCYESSTLNDPEIQLHVALHFVNREQGGEINMVLNKNHLFGELSQGTNVHQFCMMVVSVDDPGPCLLGAYQQVNFGILYDVHNSRLSFVPQNCLGNTS